MLPCKHPAPACFSLQNGLRKHRHGEGGFQASSNYSTPGETDNQQAQNTRIGDNSAEYTEDWRCKRLFAGNLGFPLCGS